MAIPLNAAANVVVQAQSVVADLTTQISELHAARERQIAIVEAMLPAATWGEPPPLDPPTTSSPESPSP
ncbi:hypothetical protein [Leucobacter luti]|uniref:hypothetical protein n=1 Tax=Leucobacter luti TaxID=340320 RepID=UPI003D017E69